MNREATADRTTQVTAVPVRTDAHGYSMRAPSTTWPEPAGPTVPLAVVVSPHLIVRPGVTANHSKRMLGVAHGQPLPHGSVNTRRSLFISSLMGGRTTAGTEDLQAPGEARPVSDWLDLSTPAHVPVPERSLGCSAGLRSVSTYLLRIAGPPFAPLGLVVRLTRPLPADASKATRLPGRLSSGSTEALLTRIDRQCLDFSREGLIT